MKEMAVALSIYSNTLFWTVVIPRAIHGHVAVRHAVLALATLHQSLVSADGFEMFETTMVDHYTTAIRALTQGQPTVDIVLITSILFYSIDFLRFNARDSAISHLGAAYNILQEVKNTPDFQTSEFYELITEHLQPVIERTWYGVHFRHLFDINNEGGQVFGLSSAGAVSHLGGVDHLRALLSFVLQHITGSNATDTDVGNSLMGMPCSFAYVTQMATMPGAPPTQGRLFFIHHIAATILLRDLRQSLGNAELLYEECTTNSYRYIVEQMETYLAMSEAGASNYSIQTWDDLGIIGPLFLTIARSPDEELAERALKLLRSVNRVEGQWTTALAANIAEALAQGEVQENLGLGLQSLRLEKKANTLHIFDDSPDPVFDHYLALPPSSLASMDVVSVARAGICAGLTSYCVGNDTADCSFLWISD